MNTVIEQAGDSFMGPTVKLNPPEAWSGYGSRHRHSANCIAFKAASSPPPAATSQVTLDVRCSRASTSVADIRPGESPAAL
ncbi:MAG: hypothetical protein GY903_24195 [Fuerstiella sp.]|nr:hypothetical protein [Fuerstiella sp.]MCP4857596.1 hypothetical protein [Fuerstiella sp.]